MMSARQARDMSMKQFEKTAEYVCLYQKIGDAASKGLFSISLKPYSYNSGSLAYLRSRGYTVKIEPSNYLQVSWEYSNDE